MSHSTARTLRNACTLIVVSFVCLSLSAQWQRASAKDLTARVSDELKKKLSTADRAEPSFCRRELLCGEAVLSRFYERRAFRPAWMEQDGRFAQAQDLVDSIHKSALEGLNPDVYHLSAIEALLEEMEIPRAAGMRRVEADALSDLDLLLTDAFLVYGSHLVSGRVDPETIHSRWIARGREADLAGLLEAALEKSEVGTTLAGLLPKHHGYGLLREALSEHRGIMAAGGWPSVPDGPTLRKEEAADKRPSAALHPACRDARGAGRSSFVPGFRRDRLPIPHRYSVYASSFVWPPAFAGASLVRLASGHFSTAAEEGVSRHPQGERGPRVAALRARLIASGDLGPDEGGDPEIFDEAVDQGVRRFQTRHGLTADGAVGPATLAALNVPVEERVRQIELNMERWRWLPEDLGKKHILVNIAAFGLEVVEEGETVLAMRVVAGKKARDTPVFSGRMTYLVLNPHWHIPHTIAVRDMVPQAKKDPGYLDRQGIRVFRNWEDLAPEIRSETIDWAEITSRNFSFKLRQDPGPLNALGRVKFMFPNRFAVYLHDTPVRKLFERSRRDFSSGCIRVENPMDLAAYVLRGDPKWGREQLLSAIESETTRIVWLPEPIPVHLLYWTAWVDQDGKVQFRLDVYGRDGPLDLALG